MSDEWEDVKRWRDRAEEIRVNSQGFKSLGARETMARLADNYEKLANHAEARLLLKGPLIGREAG